jgi:hypothetical protein
MKQNKFFRHLFRHPLSALLLCSIATGCSQAYQKDQNAISSQLRASQTSERGFGEGMDGNCVSLKPDQSIGVSRSGFFQACRDENALSVVHLDGYFEDSTGVCAFPLQTYTDASGTKRSAFKVGADGLPFATCGSLAEGQILKINFQQILFDSLVIVPQREKVNMQMCLQSQTNCGEFSYGKWE